MDAIYKHQPAISLVIHPGNIDRIIRVFILHRIILKGRRKTVITPGQFVPGIIGQAVLVIILHDRNHSRLRPLKRRVTENRKVHPIRIVRIVFHGLAEIEDYVSTECPKAQCTVYSPDKGFGRGGEAQRSSIDELSWCRPVFPDPADVWGKLQWIGLLDLSKGSAGAGYDQPVLVSVSQNLALSIQTNRSLKSIGPINPRHTVYVPLRLDISQPVIFTGGNGQGMVIVSVSCIAVPFSDYFFGIKEVHIKQDVPACINMSIIGSTVKVGKLCGIPGPERIRSLVSQDACYRDTVPAKQHVGIHGVTRPIIKIPKGIQG